MATWRLLSSNGSVNLLCTRTLATMKNISNIMHNIEKDILPPKPKKPLNPYFLYAQSVRSKLKQEYPDIKHAELIKKISQEWIKVNPAVKMEFQKQYNDEYAIYKQKLDDYNNSITEEQKELIKKELLKKKSSLEKDQTKKKLVELGKPKRPISAYFIFLQSKRNSKDLKISQQEWVKDVSNEWNNMKTEDKDKYYTKAKQLREKYDIELKEWMEYMVQTDFSNIKIQNKDDFKIGWGTDTTSSTADISSAKNEQQQESTRSFTLYNDRNNLQVLTTNSRNEMKDMLTNNSKSVQNGIYARIYKYFASVRKEFSLVLEKIDYKKWKMNTNTNGLS